MNLFACLIVISTLLEIVIFMIRQFNIIRKLGNPRFLTF